jgi:hypothetical protein
MVARRAPTKTLADLLHFNLLLLLLVTYALAALLPALGVGMRDARPLAPLAGVPGSSPSLPSLLLAFLLFHAGLCVPGGTSADHRLQPDAAPRRRICPRLAQTLVRSEIWAVTPAGASSIDNRASCTACGVLTQLA